MHSIPVNKGFTLIETLIYIALFTLILSGGFITAYNLIDSSERLNARTVSIEESNFILRKIEWVLNGAEIISVSGTNILNVTKFDGTNYEINFDGTNILLSEGGGSGMELNTENIKIDRLTFEPIPVSGSPKIGVTSVLSVNGITATSTKYMRK